MGLFGPPKTKIAPRDFVKAQLDEVFSDQFTQTESNEFLRLSRENPLFRDMTFEHYLRERRNVICNLFEIAWSRNIMDTFGYISMMFISQILPQGVDNENPAYRPLHILYGTDFTSRFIAFEALIKRHKFVTQ
jgi:hypothetical protein